MSEEYIGKVKLNYDFYKGKDFYSDGKIEDEMLEIAQDNEAFDDVIANDSRWPILYHFSPVRENIIEWYPFEKDCEILEIGSGCGAVTGALAKNGANVTCIELSKKRSLINANRHRNYDNIEILVGNFNDIKIDKKFDYITLIGVLEYAKLYTATNENPYADFLKVIKSHLKKDGKLIIAIENKFGLKYWSGSKEDHTGVAFDGIEGYPRNSNAETFSKKELTEMLNASGFNNTEFYYPYPDYKLPTAIYSDNFLPKQGDLSIQRYNYDNEKTQIFSEQYAYDNLISNGIFDFFANSFLTLAKEC